MIPYFQYNAFLVGPVTIQVWGLLVALGIVAAIFLQIFLSKRYFLSKDLLLDMATWCLLSAFLFARVFHVVFYSLDYYLLDPLAVFKIWEGGASSFGGFFGAAVALVWFIKRRKLTLKELLPYFDVMALSLWLGWGVGRIGCFLIHDHPGTLSHSMLAVQFPEGARHDLGLYESILGFTLFGLFALLFKRLTRLRSGLVMVLSSLGYAIVRFFLDFLRAPVAEGGDVRYGNLTPAQWGMLLVILLLTLLLLSDKMRQRKLV